MASPYYSEHLGEEVRPEESNDRDHFQDRTMCPVCGDELERGPGYVRCKVPSHYTRSVMSEETVGEDLRDEDGVAWGRLGGDRHARSNPSFGFTYGQR
jgi:hypothetical protein